MVLQIGKSVVADCDPNKWKYSSFYSQSLAAIPWKLRFKVQIGYFDKIDTEDSLTVQLIYQLPDCDFIAYSANRFEPWITENRANLTLEKHLFWWAMLKQSSIMETSPSYDAKKSQSQSQISLLADSLI